MNNTAHLKAVPTTTTTLAPGDRVGRYVIDSVLGEGGMGLVFRGRHMDLDMKVAIKTIRPELAADERVVARLMEEARAVASLRSDHVVRVFDVARTEDGAPYLVFELVEGPDLDRVLAAHGPMTVHDAVSTILDVCLGLAEAHRHGIIHRDIKPENLLVEVLADGGSRVKISDFGIAKRSMSRREMSLTQQSGSVGSPWYMSPEQMINARDVDQRADVWSVGVVLFELLTGGVPFPGDNPGEVCARVMAMPPVALAAFRPDAPERLEAIIARCLNRERELRYPDVAELAMDLATVVPELEVKARSVSGLLGAMDVVLGRTLSSVAVVTSSEIRIRSLPSISSIPTIPGASFPVLGALSAQPSRPPRRFPFGALAAAVAAFALFGAFANRDVRAWAHHHIDALVAPKSALPQSGASTPRMSSGVAALTAPVSASPASIAPALPVKMPIAREELPPTVALPPIVVPQQPLSFRARTSRTPRDTGDYFVPADAPTPAVVVVETTPVAQATQVDETPRTPTLAPAVEATDPYAAAASQ